MSGQIQLFDESEEPTPRPGDRVRAHGEWGVVQQVWHNKSADRIELEVKLERDKGWGSKLRTIKLDSVTIHEPKGRGTE